MWSLLRYFERLHVTTYWCHISENRWPKYDFLGDQNEFFSYLEGLKRYLTLNLKLFVSDNEIVMKFDIVVVGTSHDNGCCC